MKWAAQELHKMGPKHVLVKGGHLPSSEGGMAPDVLYDGVAFHVLTAPRFETQNTHGTGCTYAAAIATGIAQGPSAFEGSFLCRTIHNPYRWCVCKGHFTSKLPPLVLCSGFILLCWHYLGHSFLHS